VKQLSLKSAYKIYTLLCIVGALVSLYLLVHHIEFKLGLSNGKSFCSINELFDCDKVEGSHYSAIYGIPVAGFGLFFYAVNIFILNLLKEKKEDSSTWSVLKLLSLIGIIPTVILAAISIIIIQSICIFCFSSYVCSLGLAALTFRLNAANRNFILDGTRKLLSLVRQNFSVLLSIVFIGVLSLLAPLVALNSFRPETPTLAQDNDSRALMQWKLTKVSPESQVFVAEGPERDLSFGPTDSKVTVVSYSDMACPHCKIMTNVLHELSTKYKFKVIFKDYPLDQHCNPLITRAFHDYSCQAAKVARCALQTSEELYLKVHETFYNLKELNNETLNPISEMVNSSSKAASICVFSDGYPQSIVRHLKEGSAMKIPGTPAIFVNGKLVPVPNASALEKILNAAIGD